MRIGCPDTRAVFLVIALRYVLPTHHAISLEFATQIADGLPAHPDWTDLARENLDRWSRRNADSPHLLRGCAEWRAILNRPIGEIRAILTAKADAGQRLRQNSPFVGVLSPSEVWEIKRRHRQAARAWARSREYDSMLVDGSPGSACETQLHRSGRLLIHESEYRVSLTPA